MAISSRATRLGFTLMELLLVVTIAAALMLLAAQSTRTLLASRLSTKAIEVRNTFEEARQMAAAAGYPVEVRIYQSQQSPQYYSAFQIVQNPGNTELANPLRRLPDGIIFSSDTKIASSILGVSPAPNIAPKGFLSAGTRSIRYVPLGNIQGLTAVTAQTLTLIPIAAPTVANNLPSNFATISIDPVLGSTALFRP